MAKTNRNPIDCLDAFDRKMQQAQAICSLLEDIGSGSALAALPENCLSYIAGNLKDLLDGADAAVDEYRRATTPGAPLHAVGSAK